MPTVLREKGYKFIIFANDHAPAHVHGRKGNMLAKISLVPEVVLMRYDKDLTVADLGKMVNIVKDNREFLLAKWSELHPEDVSEDKDE